jgi:hypothetical protein
MPNEWDVADMLRADLAAARKQWLDEMRHDPDARAKREESNFLAVSNHDGETLDFHSLRHTCGSWLALQGIQPNVIKTVMRHSTIVLTMDTYGHLLPDQHADAIGGMVNMLTDKMALAATGTVGNPPEAPAVQTAVGMRKDAPDGASGCDGVRDEGKTITQGEERKPLRIADICETVRDDATGRGGIRTHTPVAGEGILSPQCLPFHHAAPLLHHTFAPVVIPLQFEGLRRFLAPLFGVRSLFWGGTIPLVSSAVLPATARNAQTGHPCAPSGPFKTFSELFGRLSSLGRFRE